MTVGASVVVSTPFKSNSKIPVQLESGQIGVVKHIDCDGDVEIDFKAHSTVQWVFRKNFDKLVIGAATEPEVKLEEANEQETLETFDIGQQLFGLLGLTEAKPIENQQQP